MGTVELVRQKIIDFFKNIMSTLKSKFGQIKEEFMEFVKKEFAFTYQHDYQFDSISSKPNMTFKNIFEKVANDFLTKHQYITSLGTFLKIFYNSYFILTFITIFLP